MKRKFVMWIEPHTPSESNMCKECVLGCGFMCIDRSYCEFPKTGKTWRKCLNPPKSKKNMERRNGKN